HGPQRYTSPWTPHPFPRPPPARTAPSPQISASVSPRSCTPPSPRAPSPQTNSTAPYPAAKCPASLLWRETAAAPPSPAARPSRVLSLRSPSIISNRSVPTHCHSEERFLRRGICIFFFPWPL